MSTELHDSQIPANENKEFQSLVTIFFKTIVKYCCPVLQN